MQAYYAAAGHPHVPWRTPPQQVRDDGFSSLSCPGGGDGGALGSDYFLFSFARGGTQQHGLVTAGTGAAYGAPVPFPLYPHPTAAYYAHAPVAAVNAESPNSRLYFGAVLRLGVDCGGGRCAAI